MTPSVTLMTTHSLDGTESEANHEEQRRFAEFVTSRQPRLLDFQAYVSEDQRKLKLLFAFPDDAARGRQASRPEPADGRFRDSGLAGVLAGVALAVLAFVAAYLGSAGTSAA